MTIDTLPDYQLPDWRGKYPTPNDAADSSVVLIMVTVNANDVTLQANVSGALSSLFSPYNFKTYGDMSEIEAAQYYRNLNIMTYPSVCDMVLDCISNNESVRDAILKVIGGDGGVGGSGGQLGGGSGLPIPEEVNPTNLLVGSGCDNDVVFAVAVGIIEFTFQAVIDAYQVIEAATNNVE